MRFRSIDVSNATTDDIAYVSLRMRPEDDAEVFDVRFSKDRMALAGELAAMADSFINLYCIRHKDHVRPIAITGILITTPRAGYANLIATPEFPKIAKDLTRFIREQMIPNAVAAGLRRVELRAHADWEGNCRWLEALGAERECLVPGLADNPYAQYAWTREGVTNHVHHPQS